MMLKWVIPLLLLAVNAGLLLPPLPIRQRWKWLLAAGMMPFAFKFSLLRLFGGPMFFAPAIPGWIQTAAAWGFSVLCLSAALLILTLPVRLVLFRRLRHPGPACRRLVNRIDLGIAVIAMLLTTAGMINGFREPVVRPLTITLPLPDGSRPFTMAVLADLHISRITGADRIAAIVKRVQENHPDVIVLLGDLVDGPPADNRERVMPLARLQAPWGVFAIAGNHEYYSGLSDWQPVFSGCGIRLLLNESVSLPNGVILGGVTDPAARRFGTAMPDLDRTFAGTPPDACRILLAHRPGIARRAAGHGVALQLSGHTHGGMMPGLRWLVSQANDGMVSGTCQRDGMPVIISNGTGIWGGFPIRLGAPAEILLLTIRPEPSAGS